MKHTTISLKTFQSTLARYPATVPDKLQELDALRYDTIPNGLAKRKEAGDAQLEKNGVEKLVEWKLKHGTFRPKLLQLVQSNAEDYIQDTTRKAFSLLTPKSSDPSQALKLLTQLKGIGPATASLLLSAFAPETIPFFSDELFRWCMWDEPGSPGGWKRAIKYNAKEYVQLVTRVEQITTRLEVSAVDVERVAWVLGKESVNIDVEGDDMEKGDQGLKDDGVSEDQEVTEERPVEKKPKPNMKRKVTEADALAESPRRSTRRKA
ncbi:hypothetical protein P153DRAFT_387836 [Dothidotthia symphoricarpi CBS 119687]|uniref:Uncharacterized protein n=1 Tax=Dothidotthia symphoricarpi CBS 119687 TaxID=1392245 RepID=A0A6A6A9F1_9PLEO|nr:uncharacterized protein P153DRAFT_387836 [Dothidotthia symphoricarpi CBS 119687]KAF2127291.1 hypothetical protein P153DRAFT_387836 [Dothidotthia symphoricarpi CBS 119687]